MGERISMSSKDLERLEILKAIQEKRIKQIDGAQKLNISTRQVRRLMNRLIEEGPKGIISRRVGAPSNNRLSQNSVNQIIAFYKNSDHYDFGPTLAHEYLAEQGGQFSVSSVRSVMIRNNLWHPKAIRVLNIHPLRPRREKRGELIQVDGSEHNWFEGRGPRCTLLVFIDDATSETLFLKFVKSENTFDYLAATREYVEKHGRPEAYYPDKHGVFRVNHVGALSGDGRTQFGRAMEELDIKLICANTPQAKGRVERRNRDFQNRLLKAMRLAKICNIEAANAFIPSFLEKFNRKFAKAPKDPINAHRPLLPSHNLDKIFCIKDTRRLSKNLTLQYDNVIYQVIADRKEYALKKAEVTIIKDRTGSVTIEHHGKRLTAVPYHKMQARTEEVSSKELMTRLDEMRTKKQYRPNRRHPWKCGRRGFSKPRELVCC
jgi:DNA-binding Lrp family transcriptional regulator